MIFIIFVVGDFMKKFLVTILFLMMTVLSANATTSVRYNCAGAPVSIQRNYGVPVSMSTVRSAYNRSGNLYPGNTGYYRNYNYGRVPYSMQQRRMMNYNSPTAGVVQATRTVSRFSKNYSIAPRRSYVANGVRYYN